MIRLITKYPYLIVALFILVSVGLGSQMPNSEIDPEMKNELPDDFPARLDMDRIEEVFGGTEMFMVVMLADDVLASDTLRRLEDLTEKLEKVVWVDEVVSLTTAKKMIGGNGKMKVSKAIQQIPETAEQREALRESLRENDLVYGSIVSSDFTAAAMVLELEPGTQDKELFDGVQAILADFEGPEKIEIAGAPVLRMGMQSGMKGDFGRLVPLGLLLMLVFLYLCFRQLRGVILPFVVVIMSVIVAMALIPIIGWKVQLGMILVPILLLAVANDYGIHILAHYQELNQPGSSLTREEMVGRIVRSLTWPVLLTGVTTIAGFMCLLAHVMIPAQRMAWLASAGIIWALAGSLLFIPAMLVILPPGKPVAAASGSGQRLPLLERVLQLVARLVSRRPKTILAVCFAATAIACIAIPSVETDANMINYYPEDSPIRRGATVVSEKFGGFVNLSIMAEGDIKAPKTLKKISEMEAWLADIPEVGHTFSIARVVREMNEVVKGKGPQGNRIPDDKEMVAQLFLLYSLGGSPTDFDKIVDFPYEHAMLNARISTMSTQRVSEIADMATQRIQEDPDSPFTIMGGFATLFAQLGTVLLWGQIRSLVLSLLIISVLVALLFRSFMAGLFAFAPLSVATATLFGAMGLFGIELDMISALLSSILIGVGVDYTIHFMWRYSAERKAGRAPEEAVYATMTTSGRGIVFNALSVIVGFVVLSVSNFLPLRLFGVLITMSISTCLFGALVMLPALLLVVRPRFLEPRS